MSKIKPISPQDIKKQIPDEVIECFNKLIIANFAGDSAKVIWKDAVRDIALALNISTEQVYYRRLLDVESVSADAGWKVTSEKCTYGDQEFDSYFLFEKK